MKILYAFPEALPTYRARGIQVAHTLAALLDEGHDVRLAYTPDDANAAVPLEYYGLQPKTRLRILALSRQPSGLLAIFPVRSNRFYNRSLALWLRRARQKKCAPDVILTRHLKTAYALLRARHGIPIVYEAHEVFAVSGKHKQRNRMSRMENFVINNSEQVIAISGALSAALKERYKPIKQICILHSGVNISGSRPPQKPWQECQKHIIYTGSLFDWKGVKDLVIAAQWLPRHRITIIGGTPEDIENLRRFVTSQGAEVVFMPHMAHTRIRAELLKACIAVLPNRSNSISAWTSPIKLFEYMGAECAIVASDLPSIREILSPSEAALVPANSPEQLAQAIRTLTRDPKKTAAQAKHLFARSMEFTWHKRGEALSKILLNTAGSCNYLN